MDLLLIAITVASLALALGASVVAWRTSRDERVRAGARVAALSVAAGVPPLQKAAAEAVPLTSQPRPAGADTDFGGRTQAEASPTRELETFASESRSAGRGAAGQFLGAGARAARERRTPAMARGRRGRRRGSAGGLRRLADGNRHERSPPAPRPAPTPVELLSSGHQREGNNLSVTGLVAIHRRGRPSRACPRSCSCSISRARSSRAPRHRSTMSTLVGRRRVAVRDQGAGAAIGGALPRELPHG